MDLVERSEFGKPQPDRPLSPVELSEETKARIESWRGKTRESIDASPAHLPFKAEGKYHMTMGLRKFDLGDNWLVLDAFHLGSLLEIRKDILDQCKGDVIQCLPGSEEACKEVLDLVVEYLSEKHPEYMETEDFLEGWKGDLIAINNGSTGKQPLDMAARLAAEDLNILQLQDDGKHHLTASATLFPVGWVLKERIGMELQDIHKPVSLWAQKLLPSVENRISIDKPMERSAWFMQQRKPEESLRNQLLQQEAMSFDGPQLPEYFIIWRERQTFRRLPKSKAVLFTVKTNLENLVDIPIEDLAGLKHEINSWSEDTAKYKGRPDWYVTVIGYIDKTLNEGKEEDEVEVKDSSSN
ncbi:hypothetical protein K402DRAFT_435520 [Aulographum hederae CBS 113979]|uniref:Uncharacterized protein n=1 Tax=Aulographum hederae CBS 113979 TaxID=1176131 RepID=A0A6G1GTB4_9PEZI|nr:hypothetical protein K402DRAFT_435520 [Aulographum hederae CBS 113979]